MKTNTLTGATLDYYTGLCAGFQPPQIRIIEGAFGPVCVLNGILAYSPSTSWHDCGPILGRMIADGFSLYRNDFQLTQDTYFCDNLHDHADYDKRSTGSFVGGGSGDTPMIAVCRAIVAWKFGDHVPEVKT